MHGPPDDASKRHGSATAGAAPARRPAALEAQPPPGPDGTPAHTGVREPVAVQPGRRRGPNPLRPAHRGTVGRLCEGRVSGSLTAAKRLGTGRYLSPHAGGRVCLHPDRLQARARRVSRGPRSTPSLRLKSRSSPQRSSGSPPESLGADPPRAGSGCALTRADTPGFGATRDDVPERRQHGSASSRSGPEEHPAARPQRGARRPTQAASCRGAASPGSQIANSPKAWRKIVLGPRLVPATASCVDATVTSRPKAVSKREVERITGGSPPMRSAAL